jgi:uncharacterized protein (DUF1499 family)
MLSKVLLVGFIKGLIVLMLSLIAYRLWILVADYPPVSVGVEQGALKPCPRTPNCVSTLETRRGFKAEPIPFKGQPDSLTGRLLGWIDGRFNGEVLDTASGYIHAEFRVPLLGTYDDLEILVDPAKNIVHVRSLSRNGPFNFGLNRLRIRRIRQAVVRNGW